MDIQPLHNIGASLVSALTAEKRLSCDSGDHTVPINGDGRHGADLCLAFELENSGPSVTAFFQTVNCDSAIDGMYEPDFRHPSALVCGKLHDLVIASGARREDFRNPIGCATDPARIGLPTIADDEHIGLDNGVDLVALFVGLSFAFLTTVSDE